MKEATKKGREGGRKKGSNTGREEGRKEGKDSGVAVVGSGSDGGISGGWLWR